MPPTLFRRAPRASRRGSRGFRRARLLVALAVAGFSLVTYLSSRQENPITGETQFVQMSPDQEIALGLAAAPEMAARHGGLHRNTEAQDLLDQLGQRLVATSVARSAPYPFQFHLLSDDRTVNAFALPGGQVFITAALLERLHTEGEIAGVLGHEIGHVIGRHGAQRLAKAQLTQGLTGAAVIATYDPADPSSRSSAAVAAMIGQVVNMHYGREDKLESDRLGVRILAEAGYDPRALVGVMEVLEEAARGSARPPEFFSTHPNPERRVERIRDAIAETFPGGVPDGMEP